MKSNQTYWLLMPHLVMAASLFLSGCKGSGQATARLAETQPGTNPVETSEKYTPEQMAGITDVMKLSAYQDKLSRIFTKLDIEATSPWSSIIHLKKWLFTPQVLNQDSDTNKAIKFMNGESSILGVQTLEDIWVRSDLFAKISSADQADFLLNEILTQVYLLKMLTNDELCSLVKKAHSQTKNCGFDKGDTILADQEKTLIASSTGKAVRAKPVIGVKKRLEQNDYHNIAILKSYIQQSGDELNQESLLAKMASNGFDTRVFHLEIQESASDLNALILTETQIESLFAQISEAPLKQSCYFLQLGLQVPCDLQVDRRVEEIPGTGVSRSALLTEVLFTISETVIVSKRLNYQVKEAEALLFKRDSTKEEIYILPLPGTALEFRVVGASYVVTALIAERQVQNSVVTYKLLGFAEMPGVVSKVMQDPKTKKIACEGKHVAASSVEKDVVVVGLEKNLAVELSKGLTEMKSLPPCW